MKKEFIEKEIWMLTFMGAFQRASVYKSNVSQKEKGQFKFMLKGYIENVILDSYGKNVDDSEHIENILKIQRYSQKFEGILNRNKLNIGVSQKLLNLHLKYLWCINEIPTPPHFPVDRIIQKLLRVPRLINWTQMDNLDEYTFIIEFARLNLPAEFKNIAEYELELFERNTSSDDYEEVLYAPKTTN